MASFDQKLRTLYLMEILLERIDDEHMLNASELCTILVRNGRLIKWHHLADLKQFITSGWIC